MAVGDGLTAHEIATLVHSHAAQMMTADPRLAPGKALQRAAELAVLAYDEAELARALREAATRRNIPATLAGIVAPQGGASLALAATDMALGGDAL